MAWVILIIFGLLLAAVLILVGGKKDKWIKNPEYNGYSRTNNDIPTNITIKVWSDTAAAGLVTLIITAIIFVLSLITLTAGYIVQVNSVEDINRFKSNEVVYEKKADDLTETFKLYLGQIYPDLEKSIFKDISPANADIYLVQYPELKSSNTIIELVTQIKRLRSAIYDQEIKINKSQKDINSRKRNPLYLTWLLPSS